MKVRLVLALFVFVSIVLWITYGIVEGFNADGITSDKARKAFAWLNSGDHGYTSYISYVPESDIVDYQKLISLKKPYSLNSVDAILRVRGN